MVGYFALKGPNNKAQGNALESAGKLVFSALKGHNRRLTLGRLLCPFRASTSIIPLGSQGVALGFLIRALQAQQSTANYAHIISCAQEKRNREPSTQAGKAPYPVLRSSGRFRNGVAGTANDRG
jgi:hypothetical protein